MPNSPANLPARKLLALPHRLVQAEAEVHDIDTPEDLERLPVPSLGSPPQRITVDAEQVRRLIAEQFPQWAGLPIEPVANGGWDNWTFHLGAEMSVRLPSAAEYAWRSTRNTGGFRCSPLALPLPIPAPLAKGEPGAGYPFSWSIYRWLDGETASADRIADPVRFALDLAGFLAALQSVDTAGGPRPGHAQLVPGRHAAHLRREGPASARGTGRPRRRRPGSRDLGERTGRPLGRCGRWFHGDIAAGEPSAQRRASWRPSSTSGRAASVTRPATWRSPGRC